MLSCSLIVLRLDDAVHHLLDPLFSYNRKSITRAPLIMALGWKGEGESHARFVSSLPLTAGTHVSRALTDGRIDEAVGSGS